MKKVAIIGVMLWFTGCALHHPAPITQGILGEGAFDISMPYILTNRPHFITQNCGRLDLLTVPFDGKTRWETQVKWPAGTVDVYVMGSNGNALARFHIWNEGTNVFLNVHQEPMSGPEYRVEPDGNEGFRLKKVAK